MKTAYELAMERLGKTAPTVKLTAGQKKQLAELDSQYAAKIAEREIALKDEIARVAAAGDFEEGRNAATAIGRRTQKTSGRAGGEKGTGPPHIHEIAEAPTHSTSLGPHTSPVTSPLFG